MRVLLAVQPSVSHYRAPFVQSLVEQDRIDFELVGRVNRTMGTSGDPESANDEVLARVGELRRAGLFRALYWDRGLVPRVFRTSAQAIVLEGNVYGVSNWVAIAVARVRRRKVVFWGHAWKRPESGAKLRLRRTFYALADGHLTYGEWAPAYAGTVGLDARTFVPVFNSIYPRREIVSESPRTHRPTRSGGLSLVYSGRLTARHKADDAVSAVIAANAQGHDVRLILIGDGPERERLEELAREDEKIELRGALYDLDELREVYRKADFAVSPGATGLNVIQALGFAVPVIAASGDPQSGPEIEAVQEGVTGVLYPAAAGTEGLSRAIAATAAMPDEVYSELSTAGRALVEERYTAERHASAVVSALGQLLGATESVGRRSPDRQNG
ncbi:MULTISPECIES: glycosyltransferase family 4 protein [unclassified Microbacterium]|uniref:glycosyltransferase family 4 protein n=1 Tax=unclassified Microbacterium TaxID=2609290 RepID=UPI001AEE89DE|nr:MULTISPECIES: glycosyltransferase [unclassified Microbacterium]QYM65217.1 glycosyltransferase [Microbacterium sp. Se5.02b]